MNRQSHIREWLSVTTLAFTMAMLPGASRADSDSAADSAGTVAQAPEGGTTQSAPETTETRRQAPSQIEEITVTARKREESLQSTPVAVSAFSETDLKDQDVRRVDEITKSVPNLLLDPAIGQGNSARIYLRGIGNGDPLSSDDPGVGIYVDGVYLPRAQGALLTVSDIERIEVLRGPQGTLFGKNTIGGAVNIISKKPDPTEFGGEAEVRIGNYDRFDTRLSVNIPLVPEKAAARLAFATATRDPVVKNKSTGSDFQDDKLLATRAQLLFLPSENLELNFSGDWSRENRAPAGGKCVVSNTRLQNEAPFGTPENMLPMGTVAEDGDGFLEIAPSARAFVALQNVPLQDQQVFLGTGQNNFFNACAQDSLRDERSVASDLTSSKDELDTLGTNGTITWNVSDNLTFKSITGFQKRQGQVRSDLDYTELNLLQTTINSGGSRQAALSQEFQLTGSAMDDKLNFVVGAFGFRENNQDRDFGGLATTQPLFFTINSRVRLDPNNLSNGADNTIAFDPANQTNPADPTNRSAFRENMAAFQDVAVPFLLNAGPLGMVQRFAVPGAITQTIRNVDNKSYAAYTQGTYDLTDRLSFTAGLRFTHERKRVDYKIIAQTPGVIGANVRRAQEVDFEFERSARFNDWSPMANLSFQATDDMLMYANYSKGFKSGGFNGRANADRRSNPPTAANPNPADLTQEIDDEKVTAYEVGLKSTFLDNRLVLNVAAYWNIYEDIQLTIPSGGNAQAQILILNAGENVIKGAEVEIRSLPLPGLELSAALGVANSRYTEFDDPRNLRAKDRDLQGFPSYTGNFSAAYLFPLGSIGDLRPRIEWTHRGRQGTDVVFSRELRRGKNGELDATVALALADGQTEIVLFGKNLLNREYFVNGVNLGDSLGHAYRFFNDPRTYGIQLRRQF